MIGSVTRPRFTPALRLQSAPVVITPETLEQRIPIGYNGDGALEVVPSNGNVDARIEGRELVLTGRKSGTAKVEVRAAAGVYSIKTLGGGYKSTAK